MQPDTQKITIDRDRPQITLTFAPGVDGKLLRIEIPIPGDKTLTIDLENDSRSEEPTQHA